MKPPQTWGWGLRTNPCSVLSATFVHHFPKPGPPQKLIQDLNLIGKLKFLKENCHHHSRIVGALTINATREKTIFKCTDSRGWREVTMEISVFVCVWKRLAHARHPKRDRVCPKLWPTKSRCKSQNQEEAVSRPILYTHSAAGKMEAWHLAAQGPWCTQGMTQPQPYPSHHILLQAHLGQMLL